MPPSSEQTLSASPPGVQRLRRQAPEPLRVVAEVTDARLARRGRVLSPGGPGGATPEGLQAALRRVYGSSTTTGEGGDEH